VKENMLLKIETSNHSENYLSVKSKK